MTVKGAVKKYKLDRRRKWFAFGGDVVRNEDITMPCSGCSCDCSDGHGCSHGNSGCHECGYNGKVRSGFPVPAMDAEGNIITTTDKDFTTA